MKMRLFLMAALFFVSSILLSESPVLPSTPASFSGLWIGAWTAPEGWIYTARMSLRAGSSTTVNGDIYWTVKQAPASRSDYAAKIGLSGTEFVSGHIEGNEIIMDGYRLDDPNHVLGLDKYRLVLSDSGTVLGGITEHHGTWNGQLLVMKQ
jgi:hypothetical protein